jgi:hypothetical protein
MIVSNDGFFARNRYMEEELFNVEGCIDYDI